MTFGKEFFQTFMLLQLYYCGKGCAAPSFSCHNSCSMCTIFLHHFSPGTPYLTRFNTPRALQSHGRLPFSASQAWLQQHNVDWPTANSTYNKNYECHSVSPFCRCRPQYTPLIHTFAIVVFDGVLLSANPVDCVEGWPWCLPL